MLYYVNILWETIYNIIYYEQVGISDVTQSHIK